MNTSNGSLYDPIETYSRPDEWVNRGNKEEEDLARALELSLSMTSPSRYYLDNARRQSELRDDIQEQFFQKAIQDSKKSQEYELKKKVATIQSVLPDINEVDILAALDRCHGNQHDAIEVLLTAIEPPLINPNATSTKPTIVSSESISTITNETHSTDKLLDERNACQITSSATSNTKDVEHECIHCKEMQKMKEDLEVLMEKYRELQRQNSILEGQVKIMSGGFGFEVYHKMQQERRKAELTNSGGVSLDECTVCMVDVQQNNSLFSTSCGCCKLCVNCYTTLSYSCPVCSQKSKLVPRK